MTEREMKPPSDRDLTEKGLPLAPQTGRILLIACGALAREILDLNEANGWSHLDLTCLPAKLHLYRKRAPYPHGGHARRNHGSGS